MLKRNFLFIIFIVLILLLFAAIIFLAIVAFAYYSPQSDTSNPSNNKVLVALISAIALIFGSLITAVIKPLVEKIQISAQKSGIDEQLKQTKNTIRILLVGYGRAGKTTLINNLGRFRELTDLEETEEWKIYTYYQEEIEDGFKRELKILLGDYRGQNPGMLFENFDSFAGPRGERSINCLLFVVDLYPENIESEGYEHRVKENIDFLNIFALQSLFYLAYSKRNFHNVGLFINKTDLLPVQENKSQEDKAIEVYEPLIELIKKFCEPKNITFFVKAGSALNGLNVRPFYNEIIKNYLTSLKR